MKKLLLLITLTLSGILLLGCEEDLESLNVIVPNGAPSIAQIHTQYEGMDNDAFDVEVDLVFGADPLRSAFINESHDVIIAPINLGAILIQNADVPYQLAAPITWGNLHLVSQSEIQGLNDLDGETLIVFGQNAIPAITLEIVLNAYDFNTAPTIEYVDSVDVARAEVQADDSKIALMAEPAKSVLAMQVDTLYSIDLQDKWEVHFDKQGYPQAGVFVHTDKDQATIAHYLTHLEDSTNLVNNDAEATARKAEELEFPFPKPVIKSAIPNSHIRYHAASDVKPEIEAYFQEIMKLNPALIGGSLPNESFYFED